MGVLFSRADMNTLALARQETIRYHEDYYRSYELFQEGSWLARPDAELVRLAGLVASRRSPRMLDLGCGVGRNAVPVAQILRRNHGLAVCVDVLPAAIEKLSANARRFGVAESILAVVADNEDFPIVPESYDLIAAISTLEHSSSRLAVEGILRSIVAGTTSGGYNRLEFTVARQVTDAATGEPVPTLVETEFDRVWLEDFLSRLYAGWREFNLSGFQYSETVSRDGRALLWRSSHLALTARR